MSATITQAPLPTRRYRGVPRARNEEKDLLRFTTAGSVDDGKSTLIGRLLYDSRNVYEDQICVGAKASVNRSAGPIDFSLLTDGLRAEREQGITIDVAYRYFATPAASSSSPTRRATSSTRATWRRARPRRTWRSSWSMRATACCRNRGGTRSSRRCWASAGSWSR